MTSCPTPLLLPISQIITSLACCLCRANDSTAFHRDLIAAVENIHFYFYKVTKQFNPSSVFSRVELCFDRYKTANNEAYAVIKVKNLYNLDIVEITEENKDVMKFIKNCKQIAWPPYRSARITKQITLTEISQKIFKPLCCPGQVILDNTYTKYLRTLGPAAEGLKALPIGCGSNKTWHGSPDARVRGTEIINENVTVDEDEYADLDADSFDGATTNLDGNISDESDGTMTTVEAKINVIKIVCNKRLPLVWFLLLLNIHSIEHYLALCQLFLLTS